MSTVTSILTLNLEVTIYFTQVGFIHESKERYTIPKIIFRYK